MKGTFLGSGGRCCGRAKLLTDFALHLVEKEADDDMAGVRRNPRDKEMQDLEKVSIVVRLVDGTVWRRASFYICRSAPL